MTVEALEHRVCLSAGGHAWADAPLEMAARNLAVHSGPDGAARLAHGHLRVAPADSHARTAARGASRVDPSTAMRTGAGTGTITVAGTAARTTVGTAAADCDTPATSTDHAPRALGTRGGGRDERAGGQGKGFGHVRDRIDAAIRADLRAAMDEFARQLEVIGHVATRAPHRGMFVGVVYFPTPDANGAINHGGGDQPGNAAPPARDASAPANKPQPDAQSATDPGAHAVPGGHAVQQPRGNASREAAAGEPVGAASNTIPRGSNDVDGGVAADVDAAGATADRAAGLFDVAAVDGLADLPSAAAASGAAAVPSAASVFARRSSVWQAAVAGGEHGPSAGGVTVATALPGVSFGTDTAAAAFVTAVAAAPPLRVYEFAHMGSPFTLLADSLASFVEESATVPMTLAASDAAAAATPHGPWALTFSVIAVDVVLLTYLHRKKLRRRVEARAACAPRRSHDPASR